MRKGRENEKARRNKKRKDIAGENKGRRRNGKGKEIQMKEIGGNLENGQE